MDRPHFAADRDSHEQSAAWLLSQFEPRADTVPVARLDGSLARQTADLAFISPAALR